MPSRRRPSVSVPPRPIPGPNGEASSSGQQHTRALKPQYPDETRYQPRNQTNSDRHSYRRPEAPRSFAERAKDLPSDHDLPGQPHLNSEEQAQISTATVSSTGNSYHKAPTRSMSGHYTPPNALQSPSDPHSIARSQHSAQVSPATRTNSTRTTRNDDKRRSSRDWAPARSPLQKLKVTLGDISKEEKRARVEEAEMLLREARAGRHSRNVSRDVHPTSKGHSREDVEDGVTQPANIEEAGLTRSLSNRQRERLKHSAVVESTKPDPRFHVPVEREGFDYQDAGAANHRRRSQQHNETNQGPERDSIATAIQQAASKYDDTAKPRRSNTQRSVAQDPYFDDVEHPVHVEQETTLQRNLGPSAPPENPNVQRSNSRKLQKPMRHRLLADTNWRSIGDSQNSVPQPSEHTRQASFQSQNVHPPSTSEREPGLGITHYGSSDREPAGDDGEAQSDESELTAQNNGPTKTKQASVTFAVPPPTPPPLSEWKTAGVCKLSASDFDLRDVNHNQAWWEGGGSGKRRRGQSISKAPQPPMNLKKNKPFQPALHLKCGPLLRFTGIKQEKSGGPSGTSGREIWRGSIMIATKDSASSYDVPPTLRLFSQPRDLIPPPPAQINGELGEELAPEYVDPIAGLTKLGRNGTLLYVKPVDHIEEGKDLCFVEDEDGLFEHSPSPLDYSNSNQVSKSPDARIRKRDGESTGRYQEIQGFRLYADDARDVTFWRFNLEIELGNKQEHIAYRINEGSTAGFWVPAKGQTMNIMFHSGNCFGMSVDSDRFSGPDPMWRDALNVHQTRPFHVMIGGGSQIYNDAVMYETTHFQDWLDIRGKYEKYQHAFNLDIKAELESFYLENYLEWFSQGLFGMANSQIPMVNMWDDHDIIGGFGSYSDEFMVTPVFSGLGNIAFKYYMLFQHQSLPEETHTEEPSWIIGANPGRYIHQRSRSLYMNLGKRVAFLAMDCRTERTKFDIMSDDTYDLIWNRCHQEIVKGETKHFIVLVPVPVAYPRLALVENALTSKVVGPARKMGLFGGSRVKLEHGTEASDDQWTAKLHKLERKWLIEDLQELAAEKSVRVTILGGDSNMAAVGQFYTDPKLQVQKDKDYRYMPNVISSPMVNAPVSDIMSDTLNRRNKVHALDTKTVEDMRPIFTHDTNGKPRNNKRLLPRRNWCSIREYMPGSTPVQTPSEPSEPNSPEPVSRGPGKLVRSLSLTRGIGPSGKPTRRFSLRGRPPLSKFPTADAFEKRRMSFDGSRPSEHQDSYFPATQNNIQAQASSSADPVPQPGNFIRRRTDLSSKEIKQATRRGSDLHHFINVESGLDVTLNCEVNPNDPAGITVPYRVLVPALWFEGEFEPSVALEKKRWWKLGRRLTRSSPDDRAVNQQDDEYDHSEEEYESPLPVKGNAPPGPYSPGLPEHGNLRATAGGTPGPGHMRSQSDGPPALGHGYDGIEAYKPKKKWFGIL